MCDIEELRLENKNLKDYIEQLLLENKKIKDDCIFYHNKCPSDVSTMIRSKKQEKVITKIKNVSWANGDITTIILSSDNLEDETFKKEIEIVKNFMIFIGYSNDEFKIDIEIFNNKSQFCCY